MNHYFLSCENLQELILTENHLTELPTSIGNLVKLTNLNVDKNLLFELPPEIGNLTQLGVLSLRDNRIRYLPNEMGKCKELHVLDVSGNRRVSWISVYDLYSTFVIYTCIACHCHLNYNRGCR